MKKLFVLIMLILAGCSAKPSIHDETVLSFSGEPLEVGTVLTEAQFFDRLQIDGLVEGTTLTLESPLEFMTVGETQVVVRLTLADDVVDKKVEVTVVDTEAPFIIGAFDREVALHEAVQLEAWVKTRNPQDDLTFTPNAISTDALGRTLVSLEASDGQNRVTSDLEIIVTDFSTKSDFRFFGQTYGNLPALNKGTNLVLVNKRHGLGEAFVPAGLVTIADQYAFEGRTGIQVVDEAYQAFVALNQAMVEETGMSPLTISTAYRSYAFQSVLYNNYVASDGVEAADTYSARPGFSEHQSGLAIDLAANGKNLDAFGETEQATWVSENAQRFGFIIRFPKGKERITGYQHESWHIRYVGLEHASAIEASGLTLDEYLFAFGLTDY